MAGPIAPVAPAVLRWARESIRLTVDQVAERMHETPARVSAWENGVEKITLAKLQKLAGIYKRPLIVFFLSEPPKNVTVLRDFRSSDEKQDTSLSPELSYNIRLATERRDSAIEFFSDAGVSLEPFALKLSTKDEEEAARSLRSYIGLTVETQRDWGGDAGKALALWKEACEDRHILVFETKQVPSEETRGFSLFYDTAPVVALNGKDTPLGRIFTLFHELAHLGLRGDGVCTSEHAPTHNKTETFCNRVAGLALVPSASLLRVPEVARLDGHKVDDRTLAKVSRLYCVSKQVALRRLLDVHKIAKEFYSQKAQELALLANARQDHDGGPVPQHRLALKYNGALFSGLVIGSYYSGRISALEVANCLGMKTTHIENLMIELRKRRAAA